MASDESVWPEIDPNDLWVYDKLILSRKLNYVCGPPGVPVPKPDYYITRPITNLLGMGIGASITHLKENTDKIPLGHFWCEIFTGRHLSVDYINDQQTACLEGFRSSELLYKWDKWVVVDDIVPFPDILKTLNGNYSTINCEFIGGNLIEVHLRGNPDISRGAKDLIVVWEGDDTTPPKGMKFIEAKDYRRLGFFVQT